MTENQAQRPTVCVAEKQHYLHAQILPCQMPIKTLVTESGIQRLEVGTFGYLYMRLRILNTEISMNLFCPE